MSHDADPVIQRAVDELRRLPALDASAVRRIADAAATARLSPADDPLAVRSRSRPRWWLTIGLAAAAAVIGFISRDLVSLDRAASVQVGRVQTPPVAPAPLRGVAATNADVAFVPQPFVLENPTAKRVYVVGDFNNWNPTATPMARAEGGLWSAMVPLLPGRHVYGFMVNDSVFTLDPRTPKVRDLDFGTDASVVMVGRP
jgi:hypothetical protein